MSKASSILKLGRGLGRNLRGFGRGLVNSGALKPAVIGAGAIGLTQTAGNAVAKNTRARNPPLQEKRIDTDGDGRADSTVLFDTRTGERTTYGTKPSESGDPTRSDERTREQLIFAGVVGIAALAAVVIFRGGR